MMSTRFPYPALSGDSVVCLNRLKVLSESHDIILVCTPDKVPTDAEISHVKQYCRVVIVQRSHLEVLGGLARALIVGDRPLQVALFHSARLRREVARLVQSEKIDLLHLILYRQWSAVENLSLPVLIDANDSQQLAVGHRVDRARGLKRRILRLEADRVHAFETTLPANRCKVIVLSEADRAQFPSGLAEVVPMGIDLAGNEGSEKADRPTLAFSGQLGYYPNVEAVEWLYRECWGAILEQVPDAQFRIIGRDPPASLRALHNKSDVFVTGFVPSVADELARAWVATAPMSVAWGMHTKVLEAMGSGTPVVVSAEAARTFGDEIPGMLVADGVAQFVSKAVALLRDGTEARRLGDAARGYVRNVHSWPATARAVEAQYSALLPGRAA